MANISEYITKEEIKNAGPIPFSDELIKEVQDIIDDVLLGRVAPLSGWNNIKAILLAANVAYYIEELCVLLILAHPKNRGGTLINAFNCQRVGKLIKRTGADLSELQKACVFEMCPLSEIKAKQLEANLKVIESAHGMLASINGSERYLSIACSHTVAFIRAVLAGAKTSSVELGDPKGHLNQSLVCGDDKVMAQMCKGWKTLCIKWQAEIAWPKLPNVGQLALNASNATPTVSSELAAGVTMAETKATQLALKKPYDKQQCIEAAVASNPVCTEYLDVVQEFTDTVGGGAGAPVVVYLDQLAAKYGESLRLGKEFLTTVTRTKLDKLGIKQYVFPRAALVAANLVAIKVEDGVAKTIVKSDIERLKGADHKKVLDDVDAMLEAAWGLRSQELACIDDYFGRLLIRCGLFLAEKQKKSPEATEEWDAVYKDVSAIRTAFTNDVVESNPSFTHESFPPDSEAKATDKIEKSKAPRDDVTVRLEDVSNPEWIANKHGIKVASKIFERSVGASKGVYVVTEITTDHIKAYSWNMGLASDLVVTIKLTDITQWSPYVGEVQTVIRASPDGFTPTSSKGVTLEHCRVLAYGALHAHVMQHSASHEHKLMYTCNPCAVLTKVDIKAGKLVLTPFTQLVRLSAQKVTGAPIATVGGESMYLSAPQAPRSLDASNWAQNAIFVPFWWVASCDDRTKANMTLKQAGDDGTKFPIYVNTADIPARTRLTFFKEKKIVEPLAKAVAEEPPRKRTRGKSPE